MAMAVAALTIAGATTVDANRGRPDREVPIHGTFEGVDASAPVLDESDRCYGLGNSDGSYMIHYTSAGPGLVAHLGRVEIQVDHCTWVDNPMAPTYGSFGDGGMTITAPNGDVLVLNHWGTFDIEFPTSYVELFWEVDGANSTGRFAGATGSGMGDPVGDLLGGTTSGSITATIAYDASHRAGR
jgi:hypothetical protein